MSHYPDQSGYEEQPVSMSLTTLPDCHASCYIESVGPLPNGLTYHKHEITGTIAEAATAASPYTVLVRLVHAAKCPNVAIPQQQFQWVVDDAIQAGKCFFVNVPGSDRTYLRMGAASGEDPEIADAIASVESEREHNQDEGWYSYTQKDRVEVTGGTVYRCNGKGATDYYYGPQFDFATDAVFEFTRGISFESKFGLDAGLFVGGKFEATAAASVEVATGISVDFSAAAKYSATIDKERELAGEFEQEANTKILLKVDPDDSWGEAFFETFVPGVAGLSAGVVSIMGAIASGDNSEHEPLAKTTAAASAGIYAAGLIVAAIDATRAAFGTDHPACELIMEASKGRYTGAKRWLAKKLLMSKPIPPRIQMTVKPLEGDPPNGPATILMTEDTVQVVAGNASVCLADDGTVQILNAAGAAVLEISENGDLNLRNADGGVHITSDHMNIYHEKKIFLDAPEVMISADKSFNAKTPKGELGEVNIGPPSPAPPKPGAAPAAKYDGKKWPPVETPYLGVKI